MAHCTGEQPCANCAKTQSECVYAPEQDGRGNNALKRKHDELLRDQYLLDKLLDKIKRSDDQEVRQIVSLIRSQASLDDVKACVRQQLLDNRVSGRELSPEFESLQSELTHLSSEAKEMESNPDRRKVLDIYRLADTPLCSVSASPWTSVTDDDDDLVSHLISTWLIHDKNWYDWVDEDIFLEDMRSADLQAECCSPFLVNAILAWACPYSDWPEARTQKGSYSTLTTKFLDATKQLLESELVKGPSLTLAQGLVFYWFALATGGEDVGYPYMAQAMGVARDLVRSQAQKPAPTTPQEEKVSKAIDHMVWGVYNSTAACHLSLMKPHPMSLPPTKPRVRASLGYNVFVNDSELFYIFCGISPIVARITQVLFDDVSKDSLPREKLETAVLDLHDDFRAKVTTLPEHLKLTTKASPTIYAHQ